MAPPTTSKSAAAAASSASSLSSGKKQQRRASSCFVVRVEENDVLLGRGAIVLKNEGNVRFRELINQNRAQYMSTGKHAVKDEVSRRILKTISERGGRFLRKIESEDERELLGISKKIKEAWIIVDEEISSLKVKQALREHDSPKKTTPTSQRKRKRSVKKETGSSRTSRTNCNQSSDHSSSSSSSSSSSPSLSDAKQSSTKRRTKRRSTGRQAFQDDSGDRKLPARQASPSGIASTGSDNVQVDERTRAKQNEHRNDSKCSKIGEDNDDVSSRSSSSSKIDEVPSSSSSLDLSFRLKHPSLRKRDLSRLRRQQQK